MKRELKLYYLLFLVSIFFVLNGFTKQIPSKNRIENYVVGNRDVSINSIPEEIYIDATTSMEGFAINETLIYSKFLDQLEASVITAWKKMTQNILNLEEELEKSRDLSFYRQNPIKLFTEKKVYLKRHLKITCYKKRIIHS
jgi:hypothetical protein